MKTTKTTHGTHKLLAVAPRQWLLVALSSASFGALAAETDIADSPLATSSATEVKPNIMFIFDDSGSMTRDYMPDNANYSDTQVGRYSHLCNKQYYNPDITYVAPPNADGTTISTSYTSAYTDGHRKTGSTDLSKYKSYTKDKKTYYVGAFYFKWTGAGSPTCTTSFSISGSDPKNWQRVYMQTDEEKQNFANWYSFYRTRALAMKSAAGIAFKSLDEKFRVGFITINANKSGTVDTSKYLKIDDFSSHEELNDHRKAWYKKLYELTIPSNNYTPLRRALSTVGRHYAGIKTGINTNMNDDPVQYSCQQNYAILTTDGYWYQDPGGVDLNGNSLNNTDLDGNEPRPLYDKSKAKGTLADVALYYYKTDLRTGEKWPNNVIGPSGEPDDPETNAAKHQHMVTYTMGLGVDGTLPYRSDYKEATTGAYAEIKQGTRDWPAPKENESTTVDDLWHAAVNGRGRYFSAQTPEQAAIALQNALTAISGAQGRGTSLSASNPVLSSDGVNTAFQSSFRSVEWTGELVARPIDPQTADLGEQLWSAKNELDRLVGKACDNRNIKLFRAGANAANMIDFTWETKRCDKDGNPTGTASSALKDYEDVKAWFGSSKVELLAQHLTMSDEQRQGAAGANLVNYLRGQRQHEDFVPKAANKYYRTRASVLGDIIHSQPAYVGVPRYNYADAGYDAYRTAQANRQGMVYVAGNDGMLHAFDADNGIEKWAFIPSFVAPELYRLASTDYGATKGHRFLLDGSPIVGDVKIGGKWRTLLVGGAGRGGVGYYALDVTSPDEPKALWEFKRTATCYDESNPSTHSGDCHLGRSYAEPRITKLNNGTWVVLVTSGYNNIYAGNNGDGKGYLYVLDAETGKILKKIATTAGSKDEPSGLGKITVYGPALGIDNTAVYAYAGDLLGNVWRFDINKGTATLVTQVKKGDTPQPITTRIVLGETGMPATLTLFFGTGRYLGNSDVDDLSTQTVYAVKDTGVTLTNPREALEGRAFAEQTDDLRKMPTDCKKPQAGWYIDLPDKGERVSVDPQFVGNVLVFSSNVPSKEVCTVGGGYSWLNYVDAETGCAVPGADGVAGKYIAEQMPGLSIVVTTDDKTYAYKRDDQKQQIPIHAGRPSGRIISKRELVN